MYTWELDLYNWIWQMAVKTSWILIILTLILSPPGTFAPLPPPECKVVEFDGLGANEFLVQLVLLLSLNRQRAEGGWHRPRWPVVSISVLFSVNRHQSIELPAHHRVAVSVFNQCTPLFFFFLGQSRIRLWDQTRSLYGFDHDERRRFEVSYL